MVNNINFKDKSKFPKKSDIIGAKDGNNEEIFDRDEKLLLSTHSLIKTDDDVREVAELLVKVKEAKKKKREDNSLMDSLTDERNKNNRRGSLAYRVANSQDKAVDKAITHLSNLIEGEDFPKTKDKRKEEIEKITKLMRQKQAERGRVERKKESVLLQKELEIERKQQEEKTLERKSNLLVVLNNSGEYKKPDGTKVDITTDAQTYTIKDYGKGGNYALEDSKIPNVDNKSDTIHNLVAYANSFLTKIPTFKVGLTALDNEHSPEISHLYSDREFSTIPGVFYARTSIGYSLIKIFQSIGDEKIKEIIVKSGSSKKDKLIGYIDDGLFRYIGQESTIVESNDPTKWLQAINNEDFRKNMLKRSFNEFPFRPRPDWQKILELLKELFPVVSSSDAKLVGGSDYLDNPSSSDYIKPKPGEAWKNISFIGVCDKMDPTKYGTGAGKYKNTIEYVKNESSVKPLFKYQVLNSLSQSIPEGTSFKEIIQLFWYYAKPHLQDIKDSDRNAFKDPSKLSPAEVNFEQWKMEVTYCRIMRDILKKIGISQNVDDFDHYLLEITKEARKTAMDKDYYERQKGYFGLQILDHVKILSAIKYYDPVPTLGNYTSILSAIDSSNRLGIIDSEVNRLDKLINKYDDDINGLQSEIDDYQDRINNLKKYDDFEEKDLPGKEKGFEDAYNKKTTQNNKWSLEELKLMRGMLVSIKKEMKDDAKFDTKYKDKQKEILDLINSVKDVHGKISELWGNVKDICDGSALKAAQKITKEAEKTGFSLEDVKKEFEKLEVLIILTNTEANDFKVVKDEIITPTKEDEPEVKLTVADLREAFGTSDSAKVSDDDLKVSEWETKLKTKDKIKELVAKTGKNETDNKTKWGKFQDYLAKHTYDEAKIAKGDDQWETFIKKGPKVVIGAILFFDFEEMSDTDKKAITDAMEAENKSDKADKSDLWKTDHKTPEGAKDITTYLYRKATGKSLLVKKEKTTETPKEDGGKGKPEENKSWWKFGEGNIWRPSLTYGGITVGVIAVGAVIFWKNITEWWNGPAEEGGKTDDAKEKEKENE